MLKSTIASALALLLVLDFVGASIDLVLLHAVRMNAFDRNAKIAANMKLNDKLPEYLALSIGPGDCRKLYSRVIYADEIIFDNAGCLNERLKLRKAFTAVEVFVEDQEIYKNNTRNLISRYVMEVHCSTNGTFYQLVESLSKVLNTDVFTTIAVENIHSYHHLRSIVTDLIDAAEVVSELCRVFIGSVPAIEKKYQPWMLHVFTKRLQTYVGEVDEWIRTTDDEMKLASKTLHAEFLCRRSLKARAKAMRAHLTKTLPKLAWAVVCQHQTAELTDYAEYSSSGQFYNVTAGLHEKRCTAFAATKTDPTPPTALLERLESCRQNVTNKNEIADDSVAMLRKIIDDCQPELNIGAGKQIIMVIAHEKFPGGVAVDADTDNFRELIIRRNGIIVQRILLGWEVEPSKEAADDIGENRDSPKFRYTRPDSPAVVDNE